MTQNLIKNNLIKYLNIINSTDTSELRQRLASTGYCHGFAICYGVMQLLDKLDWWQGVLDEIEAWDGSSDTLDKLITLPQSNITVTLDHLLKRVLNYLVVSNGADGDLNFVKHFLTDGYDKQESLLSPATKLDFSADNFPATSLNSRETMAGNFNAENLNNIFTENNSKRSIMVVSNLTHSTTVFYADNQWHIYDPNYKHNKNETRHKSFASKAEMCQELINTLGHTISVAIASPDKRRKFEISYYLMLVKNRPLDLLKDRGLHHIAHEDPNGVTRILYNAFEDPNFNTRINDILLAVTPDNWNGLHCLARYSPKILPNLIERMAAVDEPEKLLTALVGKNELGSTPLHLLAYKNPEIIIHVIRNLAEYPGGLDTLADMMTMQNNKGETFIHLVAMMSPQLLEEIFATCSKSQRGSAALANILPLVETEKNENVLHLITRRAPQSIPMLLKLAMNTPEDKAQLAKAFDHQQKNGNSGLHLIAERAPTVLGKVLSYLQDLPNYNEMIQQVANKENEKGVKGYEIAERYAFIPHEKLLNPKQTKMQTIPEPGLSTSAFEGVKSNYIKQRDAKFFGWFFASEKSYVALENMRNASSDQERLRIARDCAANSEDKILQGELNKVIRPMR